MKATLTWRFVRLMERVALLIALLAVAGCSGSAPSLTPGSAATSASLSPAPTQRATLAPTPTLVPTPAPTFVTTGKMHDARYNATATLLADGRVLITGGEDSTGPDDGILASAEIYDPTTGEFSLTGSMHAARLRQAAALLPGGRVLIVGGFGCSDPSWCMTSGAADLDTAEIYDPATGKFTLVKMTGSVDYSVTVTLADGRVLVLGGHMANGLAQFFDPISGKFSSGAAIDLADNVTATLLPGGKVFVTGASGNGYGAEVYDTSAATVTDVPLTLPASANNSSDEIAVESGISQALLLQNGRVLLYGGGFLDLFDPATGTYAPGGQVPAGQWLPTATLLANGQVLFEGGQLINIGVEAGPPTTVSSIYNPATGLRPLSPPFSGPPEQSATLLQNGDVLIAGGVDSDGNPLSSAELFVP